MDISKNDSNSPINSIATYLLSQFKMNNNL